MFRPTVSKRSLRQRTRWSVADLDTLLRSLPEGAVELFAVVARFEFALKEWGYCRARRDGSVEPTWLAYADTRLDQAFFDDLAQRGLCPTLLEHPPSRQVLNGNTLGWEDCPVPTTARELLESVHRVRNNLFHGGKSGTPDRDRDTPLVAEAIAVLREVISHDGDLRMSFDGNY